MLVLSLFKARDWYMVFHLFYMVLRRRHMERATQGKNSSVPYQLKPIMLEAPASQSASIAG